MVGHSSKYRLWTWILFRARTEQSEYHWPLKQAAMSTIASNTIHFAQFIEKFQEVKDATRSSQQKSATLQHNGNISISSSLSARDSPRLSSDLQNDILLTGKVPSFLNLK